MCQIGKATKVLDMACGKGTSALYLAQRYGCRISGIDLEDSFIRQADRSAWKKHLQGQMDFRTGDALHLPYPNDTFDVTFSQAFLILIPDKAQGIREAVRVTKSGGYLGWLELSFPQPPPPTLFQAAASEACVFCIQNPRTFSDLETLFRENGVTDLEVVRGEMGTRQCGMFRDEGMANAARVMRKWLFDARIKKRMNAVFDFFRDQSEYIGYGIYVGRKPLA
jgi:SAM-dependent methyltransferase